jgi:GT2 family glycosyltransferase
VVHNLLTTRDQGASTYSISLTRIGLATLVLKLMRQTLPISHAAGDPYSTYAQARLERPQVRGKFIYVGEEKLYLRGVTYGTFPPGAGGYQYPDRDVVERDFAQMAANGINAVRTYTLPPRWLLDVAYEHGLFVMVGMWWEQNVAFLDGRGRVKSIEEKVRIAVRSCAGHPAVLCYAIGNEITSSIVRWYGRHRIQGFLKRLYRAAKEEDPQGLVTYVNFPSAEYLQLPFLDFVAFNVYLESQERFESYLARLQNIAGDRPLVMAEMGLDSRTHGPAKQAETLDWQVHSSFAGGCVGAFVFAWTDKWYCGGVEIEDWDFGITDRYRRPKPALTAVREAFASVPLPLGMSSPYISVVVCSYNGARTIGDCLEGLLQLDYPHYEIIVVDDGSTDATSAVAGEYGVRLIRTENRGLSSARNTGIEAARGEIIAFIDDDARPDPHWLRYLAATFLSTNHAGVGGPNVAPADGGAIARCVANAPGGPVHVLLSDREAEHIPGCNMAFRKRCLQEVGGFDPQYRVAGDDVDLCWRIRERGWTLGYNPAAMVWHHRRNSVRAYWRQQVGYGKAEALLEKKWPEKYNNIGHLTWSGQLYGKGLTQGLYLFKGRVYGGTWGMAPFQSIYQPATSALWSLPLMPEWYLLVALLAVLSLLGALWPLSLLITLPLLLLAVGAPVAQAALSAANAQLTVASERGAARVGLRTLTMLLHLLQPLARLVGRLRHGLTPWRNDAPGLALAWPRTTATWSGQWHAPHERLASLEEILKARGAAVVRGGDFDRWDLEVRGGLFGSARLRLGVEEHGAGKQVVLTRSWPKISGVSLVLALLFGLLAIIASYNQAGSAALALGGLFVLVILRTLQECAAATAFFRYALNVERETPVHRSELERIRA